MGLEVLVRSRCLGGLASVASVSGVEYSLKLLERRRSGVVSGLSGFGVLYLLSG